MLVGDAGRVNPVQSRAALGTHLEYFFVDGEPIESFGLRARHDAEVVALEADPTILVIPLAIERGFHVLLNLVWVHLLQIGESSPLDLSATIVAGAPKYLTKYVGLLGLSGFPLLLFPCRLGVFLTGLFLTVADTAFLVLVAHDCRFQAHVPARVYR